MGFGRWLRSLYIIYPDWLWIFWHCVCCFKLVWISLSNKSIRTLYAAIEWNGSLESNIGRISNRKLFFKTRMAWIHCNEVYLQGKNSCSGTTYITMFRSDWVLHSVFEGFHCNTYPHTHNPQAPISSYRILWHGLNDLLHHHTFGGSTSSPSTFLALNLHKPPQPSCYPLVI